MAKDPEDAGRLGRLKEIAEDNKDHEQALYFFGEEMRAKRWQKNRPFLASILDFLYDKVSDYGRSVFWPSIWLMLTIASFSVIYARIPNLFSLSGLLSGFTFSLSNSFGFLPFAKTAQTKAICDLFIDKIKLEKLNSSTACLDFVDMDIILTTYGQSALSLILLFLIGLGLRNRFRIK